MLEPVRVPYIKTMEEFHLSKIEPLGPEIFKSYDPEKAIEDAVLSGPYAISALCKVFKLRKKRCGVFDTDIHDETYLVEEPHSINVLNLFVPFNHPFANKFQG